MQKRETKNRDDVDFEIKFFEDVLVKRPNFTEALAALGDLYTKKGLYEKGLHVDKKLAGLKPDDPMVLYNLACSYSLVNDIDHALATIKQAIGYGYNDFGYLEQDSDLMNLRQDDRFKQFLCGIKKAK